MAMLYPNYGNFMQPSIPYVPNQNGSIIHVQSESQAKEWPVAPGNSVTFIDDSAPYCYTKSMGMSQFDPPIFKRFRLIEEESNGAPIQAPQQSQPTQNYLTKEEVEMIFEEYVKKDAIEPLEKRLDSVCKKLEKLKELTD